MERQYTILVVDDDEFALGIIQEILLGTPYKLKFANDPYTAYQMIQSERIDIVICDIIMPEMDGITLLEKIKNFNGMIQVIMMTSDISVNNTIRAFRKGANDIFFKPVIMERAEFLKAVDYSAAKLDRVTSILREIEGKEVL